MTYFHELWRYEEDIRAERVAQERTDPIWAQRAEMCRYQLLHVDVNWKTILLEEVAEAFAENDPATLRRELVQVAAVAAAWIEAIDRRASATEEEG